MNKPKPMKCIKMRGKKSEPHLDPTDPPRRRANKSLSEKSSGNEGNKGTSQMHEGEIIIRLLFPTNE